MTLAKSVLRSEIRIAIRPILEKRSCHPQSRKYVTYLNDAGGGPSHSHRQHAQKFG